MDYVGYLVWLIPEATLGGLIGAIVGRYTFGRLRRRYHLRPARFYSALAGGLASGVAVLLIALPCIILYVILRPPPQCDDIDLLVVVGLSFNTFCFAVVCGAVFGAGPGLA